MWINLIIKLSISIIIILSSRSLFETPIQVIYTVYTATAAARLSSEMRKEESGWCGGYTRKQKQSLNKMNRKMMNWTVSLLSRNLFIILICFNFFSIAHPPAAILTSAGNTIISFHFHVFNWDMAAAAVVSDCAMIMVR